MNPATFLRVLGPEPWKVCYAEPSVRPDDSRYGDNPNRVQRHTQFQVILKPDPGNSQELYLGSLEALGIDTNAHDVRFVEDNWESPALGAWGLGWEVWLDGMEVTQFTYFQQAGSQTLEVPSVEITYGLERILMALQGVSHFKDIRYNDSVTYGELFLQNEYEMSVYNMDAANIDDLRQRFALFETESAVMLQQRLPIPAFDHVLKLSHTFNVLDARGAVGFTERQDIFGRMRALAKNVASLWMERRAELEHPLGLVQPVEASGSDVGSATMLSAPADFVLEIGTEELPPADLEAALQHLRDAVPAMLTRLRLEHAAVDIQGTPRRIAVRVLSLAPTQTALEEARRGPPRKRAFDDAGAPTKALTGFCASNGVDASAVRFEADAKGTEYCWVTVRQAGLPAATVLAGELPGLVKGINFRKTMRWNPMDDVAFSRPVRWLLAMHGEGVVPFTFGALRSDSSTRLMRNSSPATARLASAADYGSVMQQAGIVVNVDERKAAIWNDVVASAQEVGGVVPESTRADLLEEVVGLVEAPTVIRGSFREAFLELPPEVLVMVMRKHQRYFPLYHEQSGKLLNAFVTVANGSCDADAVRAGNEAVLQARFEDAQFFYKEDMGNKLEDVLPKLKGTMFQRDLGSVFDKAMRNVALTDVVAKATGLTAALPTAQQAARLAKADLATSVVTEMTALAGVMGKHYAEKEGLPQDVCDAIFEAILPRSAADAVPQSSAGIIVSMADKLDSLVGLSAAGCMPTATADPFGMRRIVYGLLLTVVNNNLSVSLKSLVSAAAQVQPVAAGDDVQASVLDFTVRRLEQLMLDQGVPAVVVRSILAERSDNPTLAVTSARELKAEVEAGSDSKLPTILQSLSRPTRIVRGKDVEETTRVDESLFECDEERALWAAFQAASSSKSADIGIGEFLDCAERLVQPVDAFFDKVFVMAEDPKIRANRLALVRDVARLPSGVLDFSQLPGF